MDCMDCSSDTGKCEQILGWFRRTVWTAVATQVSVSRYRAGLDGLWTAVATQVSVSRYWAGLDGLYGLQ
ncbi:hypothetical protein DPMN_123536 [Dreissena polymorpha]|uniref:Uncharacterized protein n=1 Tax=Dreissena polymorpha TaxID=45954 RepID=A0A9D4GRS1_DREPO|nr:hypothetical protein DPMN_123536 [Dreissena polymorpha]